MRCNNSSNAPLLPLFCLVVPSLWPEKKWDISGKTWELSYILFHNIGRSVQALYNFQSFPFECGVSWHHKLLKISTYLKSQWNWKHESNVWFFLMEQNRDSPSIPILESRSKLKTVQKLYYWILWCKARKMNSLCSAVSPLANFI